MSKMGLKEIYQMHQHLIMATQHKATILGHMPITNNLESIPNHNNIPNKQGTRIINSFFVFSPDAINIINRWQFK